MLPQTQLRLLSLLVLALAVLAVWAADALAATDYTWNGAAYNGGTFQTIEATAWSNDGNWQGALAPTGSVGTLTFPTLSMACQWSWSTSSSPCWGAYDDGYVTSVAGLSIAAGYDISGDRNLGIGSAGITATTSSATQGFSQISDVLDLDAPQTWSLDGGNQQGGTLALNGVSGPAVPVSADLSGGAELRLNDDTEVGNTNVVGGNSSDSGLGAYANGDVALNGTLNSSDASTVTLTDAALVGSGQVGPTVSSGGVVSPGLSTGWPVGAITVSGSLTLDSASALQFEIAGPSTTGAGYDYAQVSATGNVSLNGAALDIIGADANDDCPTLTAAEVDTLVTTTDTLSGTFAGVPDGAVVPLDCNSTAPPPTVRINYTSSAVTATVVYPGPSPTTTTLAEDPSSPTTNAAVTLTATVSSSVGAPAGTVAFTSDGANIPGCASQPVSQVGSIYEATCGMGTLDAAGSPYGLQATYIPNDATVEQSSASTIDFFNVFQANTVTGVRGSASGNGLAFMTAVVSARPSGSSVPTGTVEFFELGAPISGCTAVLVAADGSAACPTPVPVTGTGMVSVAVTATYSGDANFLGSSSLGNAWVLRALPPSPGVPPAPHLPQPPSPSSTPSWIKVGQYHVHGTRLRLHISYAPAGYVSQVTVEVTAKRHTKRGRTVATVIGSRTIRPGATSSAYVSVSLNTNGRRMLLTNRSLAAVVTTDVTVSTSTPREWSRGVVFKLGQ